jgi:enoyl-CoA hydratase/carnithine racemase
MRLAIALMHTQLPADTARALGLLQRVINNPAPESTALKPLARLLATRLGTQRRLEDTVERQGQQLRDHQRRIEQLSERLEAMRAIERSLTTRPKARPVPTP